MLEYSDRNVPDAEKLRDTDEQAANNLNQLQHLMPSLLEATLAIIWADRLDWFFGAIVPDGFLSLDIYTELEVLYYVIYNRMRRRKPPLEPTFRTTICNLFCKTQ